MPPLVSAHARTVPKFNRHGKRGVAHPGNRQARSERVKCTAVVGARGIFCNWPYLHMGDVTGQMRDLPSDANVELGPIGYAIGRKACMPTGKIHARPSSTSAAHLTRHATGRKRAPRLKQVLCSGIHLTHPRLLFTTTSYLQAFVCSVKGDSQCGLCMCFAKLTFRLSAVSLVLKRSSGENAALCFPRSCRGLCGPGPGC